MAKKVNYKKIYCRFFGFAMSNDEWIPSEISGNQAIDIHHIFAKKMGGRSTFEHEGKTYDIDAIENLIAVTRKEHEDAHAMIYTETELWELHKAKMEAHVRVSKSKMQ